MSALRFLFLTLLLAVDSVVSVLGQTIYITAEAGQDSVTLPCRAEKEREILAVEWSRPDLGPDYVLLFRDGHFESDGQHPSFRNRVDLQDRWMKDGDASLILKDVKIKDTGTYECRVYQGGGLEFMSFIHLEVSSPPVELLVLLGLVDALVSVCMWSLCLWLLSQKPSGWLGWTLLQEGRITAEAGQDSVTLPCGTGKDKIHISLLDWIKPGLNPDTVFYYRDGRFESDLQHPSFRNRVDLQDRQMRDGDVSLILKDTIYIKAEAGQDSVTLPCGAGKGKTIRAVEWIRPDLDPVFVFLYIDGHFHPERLHPSFKNRVDLLNRQMKNGDASLILKDVMINYNVTFVCTVTQGAEGQKMNTSIHVFVSPPGPSTSTPASPRDASTPSDGPSVDAAVGVRTASELMLCGDVIVVTVQSRLSLEGRGRRHGDGLFTSCSQSRAKGSKQPVSVATAPPLQAEPGLDGDHDDVTTEHQF
ncbi:unnamed protein product [Menidia menidia]|uniref:(Atlantic silverside) hypothetical protein n=1 Tax=Menidia menidia TaxID=238744 RepID=A0A8S4BKR1_9TELE|nr:unnamed protein product [Menidia menidia]